MVERKRHRKLLLSKRCEVNEMRKVKQECHRKRMEEKDEEEVDVSKDDFNAILRKFKSKQSKAYDFILKASDEFKEAVFRLCKFFMKIEVIQKRMQMTTLHMIWKRKGPQQVLKNIRFIHLKDYMARTCEAMVVGMFKERIF